ncbi:MAG: diguanylate cyclase [Thermaerobacter sp.]|nr:diguanylate cyclase [Thermaerobacter sp.]
MRRRRLGGLQYRLAGLVFAVALVTVGASALFGLRTADASIQAMARQRLTAAGGLLRERLADREAAVAAAATDLARKPFLRSGAAAGRVYLDVYLPEARRHSGLSYLAVLGPQGGVAAQSGTPLRLPSSSFLHGLRAPARGLTRTSRGLAVLAVVPLKAGGFLAAGRILGPHFLAAATAYTGLPAGLILGRRRVLTGGPGVHPGFGVGTRLAAGQYRAVEQQGRSGFFQVQVDRVAVLTYTAPLRGLGGKVLGAVGVALPLPQLAAARQAALRSSLEEGLLLLLLAGGLAWLLARRVGGPLAALAAQARTVLSGGEIRPLRRRDELGELSRDLADMAGALREKVVQLDAEVAHLHALGRATASLSEGGVGTQGEVADRIARAAAEVAGGPCRVVPEEAPEGVVSGRVGLPGREGPLGALEFPGDTEAPRELLEVFARQAGAALDNARLLEQVRADLSEARRLQESGRRLAGELLPQRLGPLICDEIRALLGAKVAVVLARGGEVEAQSGSEQLPAKLALPWSWEELIQAGQPLAAAAMPDFPERAGVAVPLNGSRGNLGALLLMCSTGECLTEHALQVLQAFAVQASLQMENARRHVQALEEARRDPLTGLWNHRELQERLERELGRGEALAVAMFDLDRFAAVNEAWGPQAGDEVLREAAGVVRQALPPGAWAARYGGDTLTVVLPGATPEEGRSVLEGMVRQMGEAPLRGGDILLTASAGLAFCPQDGRDRQELLRAAGQALDFAKERGGGQVRSAQESGPRRQTRRLLRSELERTYMASLEALVAAAEARDPYTQGHARRVSRYARHIARAMGIHGRELGWIRLAALLHDVGKIGISDVILRKEAPLTPEEEAQIRLHPEMGCRLLQRLSFLREELPLVRHHHERWDGQGYPDGLAGEEIPVGAAVINVADALDALTSERTYHRAVDLAEALSRIRAGALGQFHPAVVAALEGCAARGEIDPAGNEASDGESPRSR